MSFELKLYSKIDPKSKYLIDGYIRTIQQLFTKNVSYFTIPKNVNYIIAIFYFLTCDEWDLLRRGSAYTIDTKTNVISKRKSKNGSAFLTNIAEHDVHVWKFKVIEYDGSYDFMIGICKADNNTFPVEEAWLGRDANHCYAFLMSRGIVNIHDGFNAWQYGKKYGNGPRSGDSIEMILDSK